MWDLLSLLDWICVAVLLISLLVGAWRGLVVEVMSVLSWLAAFVLAQWLAPTVAAQLPMDDFAAEMRYAAGFVLVFVVTLFAGAFIGFLVSKLISAVGMGAINRLLGAMFGVVRAVLLILAATVVINMTAMKNSALSQSSVAVLWATATLEILKPVLPQEFGKYLSST